MDFISVAAESDIAAQVVPGGFGGLYQDMQSGRLVIFLKELTKRDEAGTVLRQILACGAAFPGWSNYMVSANQTEYRQAQYTATELRKYLDDLQHLKQDPDVWGLELDPQLNRIWVGLTNGVALDRVRLQVGDLGVPGSAVVLEIPPPVSGAEPFEVLATTTSTTEMNRAGVFSFDLMVRYRNPANGLRYPDQCVSADPSSFYIYFQGQLELWNGSEWVLAHYPYCRAFLLPPRSVEPGQAVSDSVPIAGSRALNVQPWWRVARVTGTYRFVVPVYTQTSPQAPLVANLAPLSERISKPFRLSRNAPY